MMKVQCAGIVRAVVGVVLPGLIVSCVTYSIKEPKIGVTREFRSGVSSAESGGTYDWSKLQGDYGLYVFSYEIAGPDGNGGVEVKQVRKQGLRVWEKKFSMGQPDSLFEVNSFSAYEVKHPNPLFTEIRQARVGIPCLYIKGHIVYGGHLNVMVTDISPVDSSSSSIDRMFSQFLSDYEEHLTGIKVDTFRVMKKYRVKPRDDASGSGGGREEL
ncbi:MAG: hypothetical protein WAU88_00320 [Candidatus Zixiibacteriota bacterium]